MAIAEPPTKIEIEQPQVEEVPTEKKPSQIIREWPEEEWCAREDHYRDTCPDGREVVRRCDMDILLFVAGYYDLAFPRPILPDPFLAEAFALPKWLVRALMVTNDRFGKDAGADLLEAQGF